MIIFRWGIDLSAFERLHIATMVSSIRLPDRLRERIEHESAQSGIRPAEIIRQAIDEHLVRKEAARNGNGNGRAGRRRIRA